MQVSWSHCVVRVRDVEAMTSFYSAILDLQVSDSGPVVPNGPPITFMSGKSSDHHQIAFLQVRGPEEASSLDHNAFRVETLAEVREVADRLTKDGRGDPPGFVTHGNAISVYSKDPEGNGFEVFIDSPWHVKQPQIIAWDPALSDEEVFAFVKETFKDEPEFQPMEEYRAARAKHFGEN